MTTVGIDPQPRGLGVACCRNKILLGSFFLPIKCTIEQLGNATYTILEFILSQTTGHTDIVIEVQRGKRNSVLEGIVKGIAWTFSKKYDITITHVAPVSWKSTLRKLGILKRKYDGKFTRPLQKMDALNHYWGKWKLCEYSLMGLPNWPKIVIGNGVPCTFTQKPGKYISTSPIFDIVDAICICVHEQYITTKVS